MGSFLNQSSFASGEISPELYGRVDQELYYIGLRTCRNMMIRQYGGAWNRSGLSYVGECKKPDKKTRLIPFQFNEIQTYVLELGDGYMRVIRNGGEVLESDVAISAITQADPGVVTTGASHGLTTGDDVYVSGVEGMREVNGQTFRVNVLTATTFELQDYQGDGVDTSAFTAYTSGGNMARVYTLVTPWTEADLFDLNYAQSNDVLTIVHPDYYPRDITRTDHDAWTINVFSNTQGPFKPINVDAAVTVYSSAVTGSATLTASSAVFDAAMVGDIFYMEQEPTNATERWEVSKSVSSGDILRAGSHYYEAKNAGTTGTVRPAHTEGSDFDGDGAVEWEYLHSGFGIVEITGFTSSTVVSGTVVKRLPNFVTGSGNPTSIWARAAWSEAEGYPASVAYHKQRLIFGGTVQQPNGIWMSGVAARTFFGRSSPALDDETISLFLDTTQVNAIRHLLPLSELVVLTSASEQVINGVDNLLLATDPPVSRTQGYTGSAKVVPIIVGNTALFVQDMGSVVRSLRYNLDTDGFTGIDLTARSPHLFQGKTIVDWDYQRHPLSVIWVVMSDGSMNGFTYMEEQRVYAWHRHDTDGKFESVACIREGDETAAYVSIKRVINGKTVRFIERFASRYFIDDRDAFFVDSGLTYDGRNFTLELGGYDVDGQPTYEKIAKTSTTITISGGTTWDEPETLTLTASASLFQSSYVGDEVVFRYTNDNGIEDAVRLEVTAYTSGTVVSAIPKGEIPTTHRSVARTDWELARNTFTPLNHIEGEAVSILADGNVVEGVTVSGGEAVIDTPAAVVHIGLPFKSQLETLDMAGPIAGVDAEIKSKTLNVNRIFITVQKTRGVFAGINGFSNLRELKQRLPAHGYASAVPAETTVLEVQVNNSWTNTGRIGIQQTDPLPLAVNSITPEVTLGENG